MSTSTAYVVPVSEGTKSENRFSFKITKGGKTYSVPLMQYVSGEAAEYLETATAGPYNEATVTRKLIAIETPAAAEDVRKLSNDQVVKLANQWAEASTGTAEQADTSEDAAAEVE